MKDSIHHRKHVQRKVIQASRKETLLEKPVQSVQPQNVPEARAFHRSPDINRLPGRSSIH